MEKKLEQELLNKIPKHPGEKKMAADHLKKKTADKESIEIAKLFQKIMEPAKEIKTVNGELITLPDLLYDDEFDLLYYSKKLIGKLEGRNWITMLDDLLDEKGSKELLLKISAIMIGRDEKFVRKNFKMGMLVSLLAPFLAETIMGANKENILLIVQKVLPLLLSS